MSVAARDERRPQTVSAVIATYTMDRWDDLCAAVASLQSQTHPVRETVVVVDHNPALLERARRELPNVTVVSNAGKRGASSTRNSGVAVAHGEILAFVDDDAAASPAWLARLMPHFGDPRVLGVGSRVTPIWEKCRPSWFPPEFDWTVGASYKGLPETAVPVRNVWTNSMLIKRDVFDAVAGFRSDFGKIGSRSQPEDVDLCLRITLAHGGGIWLYEPAAIMGHRVPKQRTVFSYFLVRCFHEGWGKAGLADLHGVKQSTQAEWRYTTRALPRGIVTGLRDACKGRLSGLFRAATIVIGFTVTTVGFLAYRAARLMPQAERGSGAEGMPSVAGELALQSVAEELPLAHVQETIGMD